MTDEAGSAGRWICLRQRVVFESEWFQVRRDEVVRPDGTHGYYDHVVAPDSVTVMAMDGAGQVLVTRQWIYPHSGAQWRLPGGRVDSDDAGPEAAARRELAEETGVTARCWRQLGVVHGADSFTNHRDHVFLATDLGPTQPSRLEPGEADLRVHWLPFEQVLALVQAREMPHAASTFAVLAASRPTSP